MTALASPTLYQGTAPIAQYWYDRDDVGLWREMEFIRDIMLRPGDRVFECGAHHGYTTLLLSKWVGTAGKVMAFEASAHNYHILQKNITLNHRTNVQAYNAAVGEKQGKTHISIDYNVNVLTSVAGKPVDMVGLDAFKTENPTVIKIDVEGFEEAVLRGAQEILKQKPKLAIEVHTEWLQRYNSSVNNILKQINLNNYDIWIQWDEDAKPQR